MKRRKWESKEKMMIVLEGIKGRPVSDICNMHQINQTQYYEWRDKFLQNASRAFDVAQQTSREARLERENSKLKNLVGELTLELKKKRRDVRMKRQKSLKVAERNDGILEKIRQIKTEHPFWGYRRIWAHLNYIDQLVVNKKRILRLMREENLLVRPNMRLTASRTPRSKPKPSRPNEWWGIDMTKVLTASGWVYIVLVIDWHTKKILGHYAGVQSKSKHWLHALDMAVNGQFPEGARGQNVSLMADNGCQPTSESFMKACSVLGVNQAFTSYNNPKGNADTERMMRTMKEELFWLREWKSIFDVDKALNDWVRYYNKQYLHSALGYRPPEVFEKQFNQGHKILLAAA